MAHLRLFSNTQLWADSTLARLFNQFPPPAGENGFTHTATRHAGWSVEVLADTEAIQLWDSDTDSHGISTLELVHIIATNRIRVRCGPDADSLIEVSRLDSGLAVYQRSCNISAAGNEVRVDNVGVGGASATVYYLLAGD